MPYRSGLLPLAIFFGSVLLVSLVFFHGHFVDVFDSDSAFNYILGKEIHRSGALFPGNVWMGNSVHVIRPHFLIAILIGLGMTGYGAYALAGSILIAASATLVAVSAWRFLKLDLWQSLVVGSLVFVPTGLQESLFVLGMQSHLQLAALTLTGLCAVVGYDRHAGARTAVLVSGACIFLIAWESPLRALLAFAPMIVLMAQKATVGQSGYRAPAVLTLVFVAGAAANQITALAAPMRGISIYLEINSIGDILTRLHAQLELLLWSFSGVDAVWAWPPGPVSAAIVAAKVVIVVAIMAGGLSLTVNCLLSWLGKRAAPPDQQLALAGTVGVLAGMVVVAALRFDLDPRHYLQSVILWKFAVLALLVRWLRSASRPRPALGYSMLVVLFAVGSAFSHRLAGVTVDDRLIVHGATSDPRVTVAESRGDRQRLVRLIEASIRERDLPEPVTLYGTFWLTSIHEVLLDGAVVAAPLWVDEAGATIQKWLTRPSSYCRGEQALLVIGDASPEQDRMRTMARRKEAEKIGATPLSTLYIVGPGFLNECGEAVRRRP